MSEICETRRFATLTFIRGALVALAVALLGGLLSAFYSVQSLAEIMEPLGLDLTSLRPLHTTFASAFMFLGGVAVVHRYFQDLDQDGGAGVTRRDCWRLRIQVAAWAAAGLGIAFSLPMGITSGREYVGFHPLFSILIMVGWLCFTWTFFRLTWKNFWTRPIYVTMWATGCLFFVYTFTEQHAWLLQGIFDDPIVDKRVQWKACGTLVGTFNLFVYGSLTYLTEKITGDKTYGNSKTAYGLFTISLLNSFTNYVHHTYHLPQNHVVKWIAFVVSMAEIILLAKIVWDLAAAVRDRISMPFSASRAFFVSAKWWTMAMLFTSLLISVPPLNALIHGTYAVPGHAMGTMIGIDTMVLAGALTWMLAELIGGQVGQRQVAKLINGRRMRWTVYALNVSAGAMVIWLHVIGISDGVHRYLTPRGVAYEPLRPQWLAELSTPVLAITGTATFLCFVVLLALWLPLAFSKLRRGSLGQAS